MVYIPTISCADWKLEIRADHGPSIIIDRGVQVIITETSGMAVCLVVVSVEALRHHSDSINCRFVLFGVRMKLLDVGVERFSPVIMN